MVASNQSALRREAPLDLGIDQQSRSRSALLRRLCEIVALPETRMPSHERQLAADILLGLLRTSSADLRRRCADGLVRVHDAPKGLLRYLAKDEIVVAGPLIEHGVGFDDSDLIATVRSGIAPHWMAIGRRRGISEPVTDALVQTGDSAVIEAVLRNASARFSVQGLDNAVARSRRAPGLVPALVARAELRATQALVLFWWAPFEARIQILRRFAADRQALIHELSEVFAIAAAEGWADGDTRKALQIIERRQRNRAAAARSPFGSLEGAIAAGRAGVSESLFAEIAHLSGIKPTAAKRILGDPGGEAVGVLCKAVGLKRPHLLELWRGLRRPMGALDQTDNPLGRAIFAFDTMATAKAQTVVRYWNWSFTADAAGLDGGVSEDEQGMNPARRNALLLLDLEG